MGSDGETNWSCQPNLLYDYNTCMYILAHQQLAIVSYIHAGVATEADYELERETLEEKHVLDNDDITKLVTTKSSEGDSNWEKVRQEVTCAICLELLTDPKSMPCLHTYCKKCLMEALAKRPHDPDLSQDRVAINCPLCRAEVVLSDQGIEALPSNFSATRLVETVQLQDKLEQNRTLKCNSCSEGDAIARCCECGGFFLCKNCLRVHKQFPATKNHSVLSLNQFMESSAPVLTANKSLLCQKHPQALLRLYCEDCKTLVCQDCVLVKHKIHNYNFVDEIIKEEKEHLQDITLEELEEILTGTKGAITGVEEMQGKVLLCNDQHVAELEKTFQDITDMLNSRKTTFLNEVRQVTKDDLCPLQKQQEDLTTLKEKVESCRDFTQKTLCNGTSTEIMSAKKQMLERTKHLQELYSSSPMDPVTKPSTTVIYQMDRIKEVVKSLGVIVDLQQCCLEDVPTGIYVNRSATLGIVLKDTKGQAICNSSNTISAKVTTAFDDSSTIPAVVLESGNGKYSVSFTPKRYRDHTVSIQINGNHVPKSPIVLKLHDSVINVSKQYKIGTQYNPRLTSSFYAKDDSLLLPPPQNIHSWTSRAPCDQLQQTPYYTNRYKL